MINRAAPLWYLFVSLMLVHVVEAQERQLGTWKMYMPYEVSRGICDADNEVYSRSTQSIFSYEKSTGIIQTFDKSNGLSDVGIQYIAYDSATRFLGIAYTDNNLDFIHNDTAIYNVSDLLNASTNSAVFIYSLYLHNGEAYVCSNLGISTVDLTLMRVINTYVVGAAGNKINVYGVTVDTANIYAATDEGVKYAPLNSPNLSDYNNWSLFDSAQGIPAKKATFVATFQNNIYAVVPSGTMCDTLYQYNGVAWNKVYYSAGDSISTLLPDKGSLYFDIWTSPSGGKNGKIAMAGSSALLNPAADPRPQGWFEDGGTTYQADAYTGLLVNGQSIAPDGPYSSDVYSIDVENNVVNVAAGALHPDYSNVYDLNGFYIYKNNKWNNQNQYSNSTLQHYPDIIATCSVPAIGKTYFGSYDGGLIEYDDNSGTLTFYNSSNSILQPDPADGNQTNVSAIKADASNNVWITTAGSSDPINVIGADGKWRQYELPYTFVAVEQIAIDQYGQLWMPIRGGGGLLVWSDNGTLDDPTDDVSRSLNENVGQGALPDVSVNCVAVDNDGNVWVGTNQGVAVFYCPGSELTSSGCDAQQIKVTLNGVVGYLFGMQSVRAMAVDAANRIWVGTTEGIWLISNDGQTNYLNFSTDNSPLPSNIITSISINNITGEVFIGTAGGLVSYQGDAVDTCIGCGKALVYPNPVRPNYTGPIAIKGLADNAYVKITDISGTLIFQGAANGTQMIWNGLGYDGARAKSGVYLVFTSDNNGKERRVARILVTN